MWYGTPEYCGSGGSRGEGTATKPSGTIRFRRRRRRRPRTVGQIRDRHCLLRYLLHDTLFFGDSQAIDIYNNL